MLEFSDSDDDDVAAELSAKQRQMRGRASSDRWNKTKNNDDDSDDDDGSDKNTDSQLSDESELSDNALEEKEARMIQRRHAEQISERDFDYEFAQLAKAAAAAEPARRDTMDSIRQEDLSYLSEKQKWQLIRNTSPELMPVISRCKALLPACSTALDAGSSSDLRSDLGIDFAMNIGMFLILMIAHEPDLQNHPITQRLVDFQQLMQELDRAEDQVAQTYTTRTKGKCSAMQRAVVPIPSNTEDMSPASPSDEDEQGVMKEAAEEEVRRRTVTDQILRNRGLTPHRKKELKNPRVKHRMKYRKAVIRRRGQIRPVRNELTAYAGEASGIRAAVKRGVRLKA